MRIHNSGTLTPRALLVHYPQYQQRYLQVLFSSECGSSSPPTTASSPPSPPLIVGTLPKFGKGVAVNQYAKVQRTFTATDVMHYSHLVGDFNPLHTSMLASSEKHQRFDWNMLMEAGVIQFEPTLTPAVTDKATTTAAATTLTPPINHVHNLSEHGTIKTKPLVHGMLASSLFSCIFGTLIPGSIYRSQLLHFRHPIFVDDAVMGFVKVTKVRPISSGSDKKHQPRGLLVMCDTRVIVLDAHVALSSNPDGCCDKMEQGKVSIEGHAQVWLPGATLANEVQSS